LRYRAVAVRGVSGRVRRNSFSGLVMLPRCAQGTSVCALSGEAAGKQTMPGSVRQSATPAQNTPARLERAVEGCLSACNMMEMQSPGVLLLRHSREVGLYPSE